MSRRFHGLLVAVAILSQTAHAAEKPIVAVFTIQDKTGQLSETTCQLLTEYLAVKLAEGGLYQIVPSRQIKDRLVELKKETLKECYDEKCQIELGKELAASKSLSTQVVSIGGQCAVMGTLYDLKRAASEASASHRTSCAQDDLVKALEKLATSLKEPAQQREARAHTGPQGELVLTGLPAGARVIVDGVFRGQAPLRERLLLGARDHDVRVEKPGHETWQKIVWVKDRVVAREAVELRRIVRVLFESSPEGTVLELDGQQRGTTPLQLELVEGRAYTVSLERKDRAPLTLRWPRVCWTLLEAGAGGGPGEKGGGLGYTYLDTRLAVPFYLGRRDEHQLLAGIGFGWGAVFLGKMYYAGEGNELGSGADPLHLTFTAHYRFQTSGRFHVGAGLRAIVPLISSLQTDLPASTPAVLLFSVTLGGAVLP